MRFIPTRIHGMLDYATAAALIVLPILFWNALGTGPALVLVFAGLVLLLLSAITRYEYGLVKTVPMSAHLRGDAALGAALLVSPFLLGFQGAIWWPHVLVGAMEIGAAFTTRKTPPPQVRRVDERAEPATARDRA